MKPIIEWHAIPRWTIGLALIFIVAVPSVIILIILDLMEGIYDALNKNERVKLLSVCLCSVIYGEPKDTDEPLDISGAGR